MGDDPPDFETIFPPTIGPPVGWWARYLDRLVASGFSNTAQAVIGGDADYILTSGILGAGPAGGAGWPDTHVRSGLVMGAVQSGKTASMFAVVSKALDASVKIVVVLAGTQVALWRQTYDRLLTELDGVGSMTAAERRKARVLRPAPDLIIGDDDNRPELSALYGLTGAEAKRAIKNDVPLVFVVMKHGQHLSALARVLHSSVYPHLDEPVHLLVLDDEADDGSILDAETEQQLNPAFDPLKQIPRHIVDLWATRAEPTETAVPDLFATYVGYTATPQANLLQADQNPLAPRDFVVALRTPSHQGALDPRATTYLEPAGITRYYTGAEAFYAPLASGPEAESPLVVSSVDGAEEANPDDQEDQHEKRLWIGEAIRSYLVAGAVRLWRDPQARRYSAISGVTFDKRDQVEEHCPDVHTMLFHPSSAIQQHFMAAAEILEWSRGLPPDAALDAVRTGQRSIDGDVIRSEIVEHEGLWRCWLERFEASAAAIRERFALPTVPVVAGDDQWDEIRSLLLDEILPHVRIAVINSDPDADERPEFSPVGADDSGWRAARDVLTIFVSGNVMARGLTLEGLNTTLFLRSSTQVIADTQMQMQRWFGYRGKHLELCRVFTPPVQISLFRQFHETDEALRRQIISAMNESEGAAPPPTVIEGRDFKATGKIAGIQKVPLCPGATPFVTSVNDGRAPDPNIELLVEAFERPSAEVSAHGRLRGRVLEEPLSLLETASLLERLRYGRYLPDPDDPMSERWITLGDQLALGEGGHSTFRPLFRPPNEPGPLPEGVSRSVPPYRCPYTVAAYLRLWDACLTRHARGLFPTDNGDVPWARLDLDERQANRPEFWVGIRFGSVPALQPDDEGAQALSRLGFPVMPMSRQIVGSNLTSTWGSRNPGEGEDAYLGDQLFDYHHHGGHVPSPEAGEVWRPVGAPGLVLFHVVKAEDRAFPVVAVGVAIPLGGPDHFAARPHA